MEGYFCSISNSLGVFLVPFPFKKYRKMSLFLGFTKIGKSVTYIGSSRVSTSARKFSLKETFACLYPMNVDFQKSIEDWD